MSSVSAAGEVVDAAFEVAAGLWSDPLNPVLVSDEMPSFDFFNDIVTFGAFTSEQVPATISASRRAREETITFEMIIYSFRQGGAEQRSIVRNRAMELLGNFEEYVRVTDTTLGGTVRHCFLTNFGSDAATDPDVLSMGRMQVLTATFTAVNRITS